MSDPSASFPWRAVALTALLPTLLFSIGEGAIIPIIPAVARDLGAPLSVAGLAAAMLVAGHVLGDIPSGLVVARLGERATMIVAAGIAGVGTVTALLAVHEAMLAAGIFITGVAGSAFALARHAFLTSAVPARFRARALSTLGGTFRLGYFIGPFISAAVIELTHVTRLAFAIHIVACAAAVIVLLTLPDPEALFGLAATARRAGEDEVAEEARGLFGTLREHGRTLGTVGLAAACLAALRNSRQVILPLWAVSIGLGESTTAIVVGAAMAVDVALFYAGGSIMDRFGRIWVVIPTTLALALSHVLLAASILLPHREWWFAGIAVLFALSNGLGSGVLMTLAADLAPRGHPAPFLGAWRFTTDLGGAVGTLLLPAITALASLPIAAVAVAAIGVGGAILFRTTLPGALEGRTG